MFHAFRCSYSLPLVCRSPDRGVQAPSFGGFASGISDLICIVAHVLHLLLSERRGDLAEGTGGRMGWECVHRQS